MKVEPAGLRIRPWGMRSALKDIGELTDDLVFMIRRAAYVSEIRSVALRARRVGWAGRSGARPFSVNNRHTGGL